MQFTGILVLITAAVGAIAAPTKLETRATVSGIKLAKVAGKWQTGWKGATQSQRYICSTNDLTVSEYSWTSVDAAHG
jgi:hypothetical protein